FKVRNISFRDSIFNLNKERIKQICRLIIKRGLDISWECNGRVNYVDEELLRVMKESGCWQIQYGVESGNQEILNKASRNTTIDQIKEAFKLTKKVGLEVHGYFMVGLPGETKETLKDTIKLAKEISPDLVGFTIAIPFPGTEFFEWAKEHKYLRTDDWNSFVYNTAIVETPQLSINDLLDAQKKALRSYYLRPSQILKQALKMRSFNDLKTNIGYAKVLLFSFKDIYRG
ncbi:MAG: radical SAM protein, partial [Nitrospirae bacterium]|nr:radical SAM protein [Nitrospirota bacterium]